MIKAVLHWTNYDPNVRPLSGLTEVTLSGINDRYWYLRWCNATVHRLQCEANMTLNFLVVI